MIAVSEAKAILQNLQLPQRRIFSTIQSAVGSFLAEPVFSQINVPSFDNSAMDGYAFVWEEGLNQLELIGESAAGSAEKSTLQKGQAIRIFTGAPMPDGADSVIMQEKVRREGNRIYLESEEIEKGKHVRYQGSQCNKGDQIAEMGTKVTPGMVSLLASVGIKEVAVIQKPKIAIIITGNEIQELGSLLKSGQIYNANGPALESWLGMMGLDEVQQIRVQDQKDAVIQILSRALTDNDVVIFTGGISVGDYDFVKAAVEENRVNQLFYKLKQRPGKPLYVGQKEDKLVFALPGNPGSVLSCFMQYVKPVLRSWMGDAEAWKNYVSLPLSKDFEKKIPLTQFLKAQRKEGQVHILQGQESFNLIAFGLADGFVEIPEEKDKLMSGQLVKFYPW